MNAEIISIGTELVTGQSLDTNALWLSARLTTYGVLVQTHTTVGDNLLDLAAAIRRSFAQAELVILTGGLGPTPDDITRQAIAEAQGVKLKEDPAALAAIQAFFTRWQRPLHKNNRVQALLPVGATMLPNPRGTAPGIHLATGNHHLFALPGVPTEMKAMFEQSVVPVVQGCGGGAATVVGKLNCFGISEARVGELISDLMVRERNPHVGTTAADAIISVRITARGESMQAAEAILARDLDDVRRRLGDAVFGVGDETLQQAVARLLIRNKRTVTAAESCTGGLLAKRLTDIPGASSYFRQAFVVYSNESKIEWLGVTPATLDREGAVSEIVVKELADGARRLTRADYGLAITGIAGPRGGTADKPVGLVFIALADEEGVVAQKRLWGAHLLRTEIRDRSVKAALNALRLRLMRERP